MLCLERPCQVSLPYSIYPTGGSIVACELPSLIHPVKSCIFISAIRLPCLPTYSDCMLCYEFLDSVRSFTVDKLIRLVIVTPSFFIFIVMELEGPIVLGVLNI